MRTWQTMLQVFPPNSDDFPETISTMCWSSQPFLSNHYEVLQMSGRVEDSYSLFIYIHLFYIFGGPADKEKRSRLFGLSSPYPGPHVCQLALRSWHHPDGRFHTLTYGTAIVTRFHNNRGGDVFFLFLSGGKMVNQKMYNAKVVWRCTGMIMDACCLLKLKLLNNMKTIYYILICDAGLSCFENLRALAVRAYVQCSGQHAQDVLRCWTCAEELREIN